MKLSEVNHRIPLHISLTQKLLKHWQDSGKKPEYEVGMMDHELQDTPARLETIRVRESGYSQELNKLSDDRPDVGVILLMHGDYGKRVMEYPASWLTLEKHEGWFFTYVLRYVKPEK